MSFMSDQGKQSLDEPKVESAEVGIVVRLRSLQQVISLGKSAPERRAKKTDEEEGSSDENEDTKTK
jgi:hypothetical protein